MPEREGKTDAELIPFYPVRYLHHNLHITYVVVSRLAKHSRSDALEVDIRNSHSHVACAYVLNIQCGTKVLGQTR